MTANVPLNIAICIGCDSYSELSALRGAEEDAKRVFSQLASSGLYSIANSELLLSPTFAEVRDLLSAVADLAPIDILTIYFAGHGGMKLGTFYLCLKDSAPSKLSSSALPVSQLFTFLGELQPRQANIVVDACQSGGSILDISSLIKPEISGAAGSTSFAFLAACASTQYAVETNEGGVATTKLVRYLSGESFLQTHRAFLDLVDLARAISQDVAREGLEQSPMAWGLNLYGEGVFVKNPHYASDEAPFASWSLAPSSTAGLKIQAHPGRIAQTLTIFHSAE